MQEREYIPIEEAEKMEKSGETPQEDNFQKKSQDDEDTAEKEAVEASREYYDRLEKEVLPIFDYWIEEKDEDKIEDARKKMFDEFVADVKRENNIEEYLQPDIGLLKKMLAKRIIQDLKGGDKDKCKKVSEELVKLVRYYNEHIIGKGITA